MTDGISTSPHCLYKSNIVDDVIINKTRQNELVKVFCEYKTEFLILFDDFFRSQDFPKLDWPPESPDNQYHLNK